MIWCLFCARGLFSIASLPLWEGFDEWAHYAVIQRMATAHQALVPRDAPVSQEVALSLHLAPRRPGGGNGELEFGEYWRLPEAERIARENELRALPRSSTATLEPAGEPIYEAQQAPLYYWLLTPFYSLFAGTSFLTRVWLLRLCGLLLASSVVPLTFYVACEAGCGAFQALGIAALTVSLPQMMMLVNHIGNECLAIPMGAVCLLALLRWKRRPDYAPAAAMAGLAFGTALLTKAYFLALAPVFFVVFLFAVTSRAGRQAALMPISTLAISGWWYWRVWTFTHTLTGEQVEVAGAHIVRPPLLTALRHLDWRAALLQARAALDFAVITQTWIGNWTLLVLRSWMYRVVVISVALAAIGLVFRFRRRPQGLPARSDLALLLGVWISFEAAVLYQSLRSYQFTGSARSMGYYVLAVAVAAVITVVIGLEELAPRSLVPAVLPLGVLYFVALELAGLNLYSLPYYAGITTRLPQGSLPALSISILRHESLHGLFERLAHGKPGILSSGALEFLWVLYLLAIAGIIALAVWTSILRCRKQSRP